MYPSTELFFKRYKTITYLGICFALVYGLLNTFGFLENDRTPGADIVKVLVMSVYISLMHYSVHKSSVDHRQSIISWFSIIISILGLLIIIIALIRALYVRNKRKKLIVEGELSNYLKFDATSGRVHESELATNTVQL